MEIIVKAGVVVYLLLAMFSMYLLWNNASASDALRNTGIAVATILPLLVAVLSYLVPEKLERRFSYILFYDSKSHQITSGNPPNVYYITYTHMFSNLSQVPNATSAKSFTDIMGGQGLDILEKGVLEALCSKFFANWDIVERIFPAPTWKMMEYAPGGSSDKKVIELAGLQKLFNHNRLVAHPRVLGIPNLTLPPDSSLEVDASNIMRAIKIRTPLIAVTIKITQGAGGVAQGGIWGVLPADPTDMNRYYAVQFPIQVSAELSRFKKYSPSMGNYRRWFENLSQTLSQYDWMEVDRTIQETLTRSSISKRLGIPSN